VSSGLSQADLGTGAGISPAFHHFLCSDGLISASPPLRYVRGQVAAVTFYWRAKAGSLNFFQIADVIWPTEHYSTGKCIPSEEAKVARGDLLRDDAHYPDEPVCHATEKALQPILSSATPRMAVSREL
jgi:hypothetical protein